MKMLNARRLFALAVGFCCWGLTQAVGQAPAPKVDAKAAPGAWKAPRLSDGRPDLQGYWSSNMASPLQRPAGAAEFLTDDEIRARTNGQGAPAPNNNGRPNPFPGNFGIANAGSDVRYVTRRTSIITDPPDGKLPPMTPAGKQRWEEAQEHHRLHPHDGPEDLSTMERCITWITSGPPILPTFYNNNHHIIQTPENVMIMTEMVHDVRIIPVDGSPHTGVPQWKGDSVGHYEGDTLVVETINFNGKRGFFEIAATEGGGEPRPDKRMKVTERFTRIEPNVLRYQFTVDNPDVYSKPWSGEIDMQALQGPLLEYACLEGDQGMLLILKGAREDEKAAAGKK